MGISSPVCFSFSSGSAVKDLDFYTTNVSGNKRDVYGRYSRWPWKVDTIVDMLIMQLRRQAIMFQLHSAKGLLLH